MVDNEKICRDCKENAEGHQGACCLSAELEEQYVIMRLRAGDTNPFGIYWSKHREFFYNLCLKWTVGNHADAEDMLSKAAIKALSRLSNNSDKIANFRSWLVRLIYNLCVDMHRERKKLVGCTENLPHELPELIYPAESPEMTLLFNEKHDYLYRAIATLPQKLRAPFLMRVFQELSYAEIAYRLNLSNENVRKRVQQARNHLKERLQCYYSGQATAEGEQEIEKIEEIEEMESYYQQQPSTSHLNEACA